MEVSPEDEVEVAALLRQLQLFPADECEAVSYVARDEEGAVRPRTIAVFDTLAAVFNEVALVPALRNSAFDADGVAFMSDARQVQRLARVSQAVMLLSMGGTGTGFTISEKGVGVSARHVASADAGAAAFPFTAAGLDSEAVARNDPRCWNTDVPSTWPSAPGPPEGQPVQAFNFKVFRLAANSPKASGRYSHLNKSALQPRAGMVVCLVGIPRSPRPSDTWAMGPENLWDSARLVEKEMNSLLEQQLEQESKQLHDQREHNKKLIEQMEELLAVHQKEMSVLITDLAKKL
eukprot:m51a1_g3663 hypothetical protein (291) ;mRNA; r:246613-249226